MWVRSVHNTGVCAADREVADIRVWRAMLQAGGLNCATASMAENLHSLMESAGRHSIAPPEGDKSRQCRAVSALWKFPREAKSGELEIAWRGMASRITSFSCI